MQTTKPIDRVALLLAPIALIILIVVFSGWTGDNQGSAIGDTAWVLITSGAHAVAWFIAAIGYGLPLRYWLAQHARDALSIQVALGIAALMMIDAALGAIGLLQSPWIARAVIFIGVALAALQCVRWLRVEHQVSPPNWLTLTCLPSVAVLLVAACSAPGWLWSSEFGGYDALSYHVQLPQEWHSLGRLQGLGHNVYSFLPSYVEAAFYHLKILHGAGVESAYACQLLHAGFAVISALVASRFAGRIAGRTAGTATCVALLATPWVIVVGSLAYNEVVVVLMLAAGLIVIAADGMKPWQRGALVGILSGAACGAKLTAVGMVAVPLVSLLLFTANRRTFVITIAAVSCAAIVTLLPYLIRNWTQTGNPLFPFATGLFGTAHWSAEQAAIWSRGHHSNLPISGRFVELWNQFLRYGIGANPDPQEPWKPQWAVMPALFFASMCIGLTSKSHRRWFMLLGFVCAIQICFWLAFTHLKSRFLLPTIVPMSIGTGIALHLVARQRPYLQQLLASLALLVVSAFTIFIFASERNGSPAAAIGSARLLNGDSLGAEDRATIGANTLPAVAINHLLTEHSKTLLIGDAKPYYYRVDRITYQTTWDRGVLSELMRDFPDDPARWASELRRRGFTHILVDAPMLRRWHQSSWNDPRLTADRVIQFAQSQAKLKYSYPDEIAMYELNPE